MVQQLQANSQNMCQSQYKKCHTMVHSSLVNNLCSVFMHCDVMSVDRTLGSTVVMYQVKTLGQVHPRST